MSREPPRRGRPVGTAALGGFVLGAGTVLLIVWIYGGGFQAPGGPAPPLPRAASTGAMGASGAVEPPAAPTVASPAPSFAGPSRSLPLLPWPPSASGASPSDLEELRRRSLLVPVAGARREDLRESFDDARDGSRRHEAIDISAPRNTPVLAVEDGRVAKLFLSKLGGNTIYQFDTGETFAYYYAHLDRYAEGLAEGSQLKRGQIIGFVGTSGNAPPNGPHLHFAIFRLNPDKHWWQGTPIDPYPVLR